MNHLKPLVAELKTSIDLLLAVEMITKNSFISSSGRLDKRSKAYKFWKKKDLKKENMDRIITVLNQLCTEPESMKNGLQWAGEICFIYTKSSWYLKGIQTDFINNPG